MMETDVRAALTQTSKRTLMRGDYDLNPDHRAEQSAQIALKPAAVLVPIMQRKTGLTLLFTKRTATLKHHADQVSFPGGRVETADADTVATALREAYEEIGLPHHNVDVIGRLDDYETRTGFHIVPIVGFVEPDFDMVLNPHEVAAVFEVPLSHVINAANHQQGTASFNGRPATFYELPYEGYRIWGATAGILVNLAHVLNGTLA